MSVHIQNSEEMMLYQVNQVQQEINRECGITELNMDVQGMCLVHMHGIPHYQEKNKESTF